MSRRIISHNRITQNLIAGLAGVIGFASLILTTHIALSINNGAVLAGMYEKSPASVAFASQPYSPSPTRPTLSPTVSQTCTTLPTRTPTAPPSATKRPLATRTLAPLFTATIAPLVATTNPFGVTPPASWDAITLIPAPSSTPTDTMPAPTPSETYAARPSPTGTPGLSPTPTETPSPPPTWTPQSYP